MPPSSPVANQSPAAAPHLRNDGLVEETRLKILEAALKTIGRVGPHRLTMTDVSDVARVSRGTVYRYFATRDELFEGVMLYETERFERDVNDRLAGTDAGGPRLTGLVEFLLEYLEGHPALNQLLKVDPRYVLEFLWKNLDTFRTVTLGASKPLLSRLPLVESGLVREEALNELLLRVLISFFLLPRTDDDESLAALGVVLRSLDTNDSEQSLSAEGAR